MAELSPFRKGYIVVLCSLTVEGINDKLVIESLQKGTIKLSPFRKGYIVVL
jgi:hypothetical protein